MISGYDTMRTMMVALGALMLAGCDAPPAAAPVEEAPATLPAGKYQLTTKITAVTSTDKTKPATKLKAGDTVTGEGCIGADGQPPAALFAVKGDTCTPKDVYARGGRLSASYSCTRAGKPGNVTVGMDGSFTRDGMTGTGRTTTFFIGDGDYTMVGQVSGKRVGQCTA